MIKLIEKQSISCRCVRILCSTFHSTSLEMGRVTLLALILTLDLEVSSGQAFQIDEGLDRQVKVGTVLEKPWAYYDDDGTLKGYAIDIAQRQVSRLPYTNFF